MVESKIKKETVIEEERSPEIMVRFFRRGVCPQMVKSQRLVDFTIDVEIVPCRAIALGAQAAGKKHPRNDSTREMQKTKIGDGKCDKEIPFGKLRTKPLGIANSRGL